MEYSSRAELEHLVFTKKNQGWSQREIARVLQVSRNTVKKIIKKINRQRDEGHDVLLPKVSIMRPSKLDEHLLQIKALLEKYPDITGQRVFEEVREKGYTGKLSILREKLRELRPGPVREPHIRFETDPGKQGQMDWSPYKLKFADGDRHRVECYSYILGFSRRQYIDFSERRDFYTLIRRHTDTFEYYGGVPEECLYDSEKTIVLRWESQKAILQPSFLQFITHYDCKPRICTRGKPRIKGKIEEPFKYVEGNFLNGRDFSSMEELRQMARWWMQHRSDPHPHQTTRRPPFELFMAEEAHKLNPLPLHPYDTSEVGFQLCGMDGFVRWRTNLYSVPYEHVGEIMTVKATESEIIIYSPDLDRVARHERVRDSMHQRIELSEHRVNAKQIRYGLEPVRETFLTLGEAAEKFLKGLERLYPRNCGYHARRILQLKESYHSDDVHRALVHAIRYHAYDCLAVERILKARSKPRTLEEYVQSKSAEQLRGVLPAICQRSLSEYQNLFSFGEETETAHQTEEESYGEEDQSP